MSELQKILKGHTPRIQPSVESKSRQPVQGGQADEFAKILREHETAGQEVQFSQHAVKRLAERQIDVDNNEYLKLKEAFQKLQMKGGKDSLVITPNAAYIVDVPNQRVVTALDKNQMSENVFTKIDSTVFIN